MKWSAVRRKLGRVDRAIDKAIEKAEMPGAVLLARMPQHGEVIEHFSRHGLAVYQYLASVRVSQTRQQAQKRRFAHAVATGNEHRLARSQHQVDRVRR